MHIDDKLTLLNLLEQFYDIVKTPYVYNNKSQDITEALLKLDALKHQIEAVRNKYKQNKN